MAGYYNQKLFRAASTSALKSSSTPILLCDERFRLCMYSSGAASSFPKLSIGKNMATLFSAAVVRSLSETASGCFAGEVKMSDYHNTAYFLVGSLEHERYIAVILNTFPYEFVSEHRRYLDPSMQQLADVVAKLLQTTVGDSSRIEMLCRQIQRLRKYALLSTHRFPPTERLPDYTELAPELHRIAAAVTSHLASIGVRLFLEREKAHGFFADCPPQCFTVAMTTLIAAGICVSQDGVIPILCEDAPMQRHRARISIMMEKHILTPEVVSWEKLAEQLPLLQLDMLAACDLAARYSMSLSCSLDEEGRLLLALYVPLAAPGKAIFHSPAYTVEQLFLESLASQLCRVVLSSRSTPFSA